MYLQKWSITLTWDIEVLQYKIHPLCKCVKYVTESNKKMNLTSCYPLFLPHFFRKITTFQFYIQKEFSWTFFTGASVCFIWQMWLILFWITLLPTSSDPTLTSWVPMIFLVCRYFPTLWHPSLTFSYNVQYPTPVCLIVQAYPSHPPVNSDEAIGSSTCLVRPSCHRLKSCGLKLILNLEQNQTFTHTSGIAHGIRWSGKYLFWGLPLSPVRLWNDGGHYF